MESLIAQSHAALEKLSIEERAKIPGGLPDELSIKDIAMLWVTEDDQKQSALMTALIELCRNDKLDYEGNIDGWSYKGDFFDGTNNNPFPKITTALTTPDSFSDSQFAYRASAGAHHCLIHKHELKLYLQSKNQWPVKNCLLANWWHEPEQQAEPGEDPRLKYADKFSETLSLSELMQRWSANYNFINELCRTKKLMAYRDSREVLAYEINGSTIFVLVPSLNKTSKACIIEDINDCPKYEVLPDDVYFYWTEILSFEDVHSEIKGRLIKEQDKIIEQISVNYPSIEDESISSIPTLEYGDSELSQDDAIGLYPALKILGDDWTAEEFALQVFYGGIRTFEKSKTDEVLRPVTNIQQWLIHHGLAESFSGELYSLKKIMLQYNYSKSELSKFKPEYRYISFDCVKTQVSEIIGNLEDAEEFLIDAIERHKIIPYHPFVGIVTPELSMNGGRWSKSYFQDWKLTKLLSNEFRDLEVANDELNTVMDEVIGSQRNNQQYERKGKYGERDKDAAEWLKELKESGVNINIMTNPQIYCALKSRNKDLWGKGFYDWNREQTVWPKKRAGRKKGK
jgi:hypothetical protein